jgi:hypothetical protein
LIGGIFDEKDAETKRLRFSNCTRRSRGCSRHTSSLRAYFQGGNGHTPFRIAISMNFLKNAWSGFKRYVQDVRIDADFESSEKALRAVREAEAARRFDPSQLLREIEGVERTALAAAGQEFGSRLADKQSAIKALTSVEATLQKRIELMGRDFRQELDGLHEEKARLFRVKDELQEEKRGLEGRRAAAKAKLRDAYDDKKAAQASIDAWHRKSKRTPLLFGNSGKKLPKHALFGQSLGDLDGYKRRSESAGRDIGRSKSEIADIQRALQDNRQADESTKASLARVSREIEAVKAARHSVYELKRQGVHLPLVEQEHSAVLQQQAQLSRELQKLEVVRDAFVVQQRVRLGWGERMATVDRLKLDRFQFMAAFEVSSAVAARREAHRQSWLQERGG